MISCHSYTAFSNWDLKKILQQVAFYLAAAVVAFLIVEIGYRANMLLKDPRIQLRPENITELPITAYTRSLWQFNAAKGFYYADRTGIFVATVSMGRIAGCSAVDPINKDGSPGISEGKYENADFKVAVFGDSFSVFVDGSNSTWVNHLQVRLQEKLGCSVHILNFAHDGSGLLQMFDVAAFELPKWKPDLAIIAFNTVSMMEPRIWRVAKSIAGEPRVLTTLNQTENPNLNDPYSVYDTAILDSDINAEWCEKNKKGGELDRVGRDIVDKYLRFRARRYSAFTLSHSFFWNRVVNADAFYSGGKGRVLADEIANDLKFATDIKTILESGTPLLLVHLPYSLEVSAGVEFVDKKSEQFAKEVSRIAGQPVHGLIDRIGPIDRPDRMNNSSSDRHPSAFGMDLYAEAVSNIVLQDIPLCQRKQH